MRTAAIALILDTHEPEREREPDSKGEEEGERRGRKDYEGIIGGGRGECQIGGTSGGITETARLQQMREKRGAGASMYVRKARGE